GVGYVHEDGSLDVVDRLKDMVIRGGENVYGAEVEAAIVEHPDVLEVAIIGLPEEHMGERVCAVVVQRPGTEITLDDIRDFTSSRLAYFKQPEALFIAGELPRTATAKIDKLTLRTNVLDTADRIERTY
ncbi:MAG: long-chain fatty acid--CoA ligase, partial [Rhodococcus sp.]|nr:long-chain fatty acid--CoA ligase [Rhodococcus sp. (in: high G+C Gram-positive bacteria)]